MPTLDDTLTYAQINEALRAVSDTYEHRGQSGGLSAPAHEVLQAAWKQLRELGLITPVTPKEGT